MNHPVNLVRELGRALAYASSRGKQAGDIAQGMIDRPPMKTVIALALSPAQQLTPALAIAATIWAAAPALAYDGSTLKTMPRGSYQCALPGDAELAPMRYIAEESFTIGASSSYSTAEGRGNYLLKGKQFTFTSGPKRGQKFRHTGTHELQKLESDGSLGKLICSRTSLT